MKKTLSILAVLLVTTCLFVSCKADPEPEPAPAKGVVYGAYGYLYNMYPTTGAEGRFICYETDKAILPDDQNTIFIDASDFDTVEGNAYLSEMIKGAWITVDCEEGTEIVSTSKKDLKTGLFEYEDIEGKIGWCLDKENAEEYSEYSFVLKNAAGETSEVSAIVAVSHKPE